MEAKRGEGNCSGRFQNVPSRNARFWVEEPKAGGEKPFPFSRRKSWLVVSRMTVRRVRWYHDDERKKSEKSRGRTSITLEKRKTRTDQEEKETRRVV